MGFFDKAVNATKSAVKSADEKLGNFVDSEKLDSKIRDQERDIENFTKEVGEIVVRNLKEEKEIDLEAINVLIAKIKVADEEICKLKSEKNDLKIKECDSKIEKLESKKGEVESEKEKISGKNGSEE